MCPWRTRKTLFFILGYPQVPVAWPVKFYSLISYNQSTHHYTTVLQLHTTVYRAERSYDEATHSCIKMCWLVVWNKQVKLYIPVKPLAIWVLYISLSCGHLCHHISATSWPQHFFYGRFIGIPAFKHCIL